jgi:hypothetical protein
MSQTTLHTIPAATITHTIAVICGEIASDIAVHHARTTDARIGLAFGTTLMNLYSASAAAQGLLEAFAAARALMARVPREITAPQHRPTSRSPAPPWPSSGPAGPPTAWCPDPAPTNRAPPPSTGSSCNAGQSLSRSATSSA